ncbi:MAG TPA: PEP-CTERM sorting domain-containing protein [Candidatus Sulfotelmatobacter sp.]|nr:PEP-CTERM sorting domain-containing protein [Candidatus Sulfotelmatobacter sp.]
MRAAKFLLFLVPLTFIASMPAVANTCNAFATYTCSASTPDVMHVNGTANGAINMNILTSNTFTISVNGNKSFAGDDLIILAAAPNGLTGSVNGINFTSLASFPEGGALGAIQASWTGLGFAANNQQFGYANVGVMGSNPMTITASGVGQGTILYAELVNPETGKILYITPNSEAGVLDGGSSVTPEPASLTLMGTGLAGLAGLIRRKIAKK